jgi:hypothetical protein
MGIVFRARQTSLGREVAVKLMRDGALARPQDVQRFRAEAASVAKLKHPAIVPIYEAGEADGQPYLVMELVEGRNLAEMTREGPMAARDAATLVAGVADAVQHAHQQSVLHRDLKPSNVLLDAGGQPRVTDFGLARALEGDTAITLTGQVLGTPGYLAPEQARGAADVGPSADVYGLGAILFHLLTGRAPFVGSSTAETLAQVLQGEALSPRLLNPAVPMDLAAVCQRCLAKDPSRRYTSAGAVAADLHRFLAGEPTKARLAGWSVRFLRWCARKPALAGAVIALHLVGVTGLAGITWQWRQAVAARAEAARSAAAAEQELRRSELAQLRLLGSSRPQGHTLERLRLIANLATNAPSDELRDLAIHALGSSDVRPLGGWHPLPVEPVCPPALDGQLTRVALSDATGGIHLLSYPDGHVLGRLALEGTQAGSLEWVNQDRDVAAVLRDGRVLLVDAGSAHVRFEADGCSGSGRGHRLAVNRAGTFLALSGNGNRLRVFDLGRASELPSLTLPSTVESLAFAASGDRLAISYMNHLEVREFPSLRLLTEDRHDWYFANQLLWEPHDRWVFGAMQGWSVSRLHPGLGKEGQFVGAAHSAAAWSVSRNDRGSLLVSSGADHASYLWEAHQPVVALSLPGVTALRFAVTGNRFAVWHQRHGLATFEALPAPARKNLVGSPLHTLQVRTCCPHPRLPLVAAASPFHAAVFDLETGETRVEKDLPDCAGAWLNGDATELFTVSVLGVQAWPIRRADTGRRDPWNLGSPRLVAALGINFKPGAGWDPAGGRLFASGSDRTVVVDLGDGSVRQELPAPIQPAIPAVAPDGGWWAYSQVAPEGTWLTLTDQPADRRLLTPTGGSVAINSDGSLLAVTGSTRVECIETKTWTLRWSVPVELGPEIVTQNAFSSDGRCLGVALNRHQVALLRADTGQVIARFGAPTPRLVYGVGFGRDDSTLFIPEIQSLMIWDLGELRRRLTLLGLHWPTASHGPAENVLPRR